LVDDGFHSFLEWVWLFEVDVFDDDLWQETAPFVSRQETRWEGLWPRICCEFSVTFEREYFAPIETPGTPAFIGLRGIFGLMRINSGGKRQATDKDKGGRLSWSLSGREKANHRIQGKPPMEEDKFPAGDPADNNFSGKSSPFIFPHRWPDFLRPRLRQRYCFMRQYVIPVQA
jgi:hypothetical protein